MDLQQAKALALALVSEHVDPMDASGGVMGPVGFRWTSSCRVLGAYEVRKHRTPVEGVHAYTRTLILSRPMTEVCDEPRVRETILHEIAHARAGIRAGHGPLWAEQCNLLGIEPVACGGVLGESVPLPRVGLRARCPSCGKVHWRPRRPRVGTTQACGMCSDRVPFVLRILAWERAP